jgi:glucose/arabinose dehydrogenase
MSLRVCRWPGLELRLLCLAAAGCALAMTFFGAAHGQVLQGQAALGDWHADKPGVRRHLTARDLPAVSAPSYGMAEDVPMPAGAKPLVPDGFSVEMVASGLRNPRAMRIAPNGDLFVADSMANEVHVYRMAAGSAKPARHEVFATGLFQPYGIAFYPAGANPQWVYIANSNSVVRFRYANGDAKARGKAQTIVDGIPAAHHWTRDLVVAADGKRFMLSVGSGSNVALDMFPEPYLALLPKPHSVHGLKEWIKDQPLGASWDTEEMRADVLSFNPQGGDLKIHATGLRNCAGMTIQPATRQLWCVVNERDEIGDNTPFEYATHVQEGAFYGWPWYYIGANQDPRKKDARPDLKDKVTVPDVLMQAHSAPLQIAFYEGTNFPPEYKGSAFVAMHGSWNRAGRTGYKVVRLLFDGSGKATGEYEDFMTGFVVSDTQVWGRPVGVAVAKDGALLVSEDGTGTIWRVTHRQGQGSR